MQTEIVAIGDIDDRGSVGQLPGLPGNPIMNAVLPNYITNPGGFLKDNWVYVAGFTLVLGLIIGYGMAPKGGNHNG